jgi:hypothetical protein
VTSRKVAGSILDEIIGFFTRPNTSSRNLALGSTQPLTETSPRNLPEGKGQSALKADVAAICEPIVQKICKPRRLTTVMASTACYKDSFTFYPFLH